VNMRRGLLATALAVGLGLASACAHTAVPSDQLASAQANIARAEQLGANDNPDAAYHLRLARQQLDEGKKLIDKKENLEASYVLKRASADGELAMAIADYGVQSTEAQQAQARLQSLRERNTDTNSNTDTSSTVTPSTTEDVQSQTIQNNNNTNYQTR